MAGDAGYPQVSLAPGFSRVCRPQNEANRFNGLPGHRKPLKRFSKSPAGDTRLKPGANEMAAQFIPATANRHFRKNRSAKAAAERIAISPLGMNFLDLANLKLM
jgi:hypothetical protein